MKRAALLVSLLLAAAGATRAAPPEIPDQVPYSAVLAGGGAGPVDLTIRIYDAATGGTLLYVQDFAAVPLADGALELAIGPVGSAKDVPVDPLTTDLATALAGDLAATAPGRFIEVTVDTDPPLPRERVLAVPFALRTATAEHAESADSATSADTVVEVGGLPPEVLTQIYENTNFDGGPPNTDPREGLGDVDGDGIANFMDADNDGDGVSDSSEIAGGSDINLVTPTITGFSPPFVPFGDQQTVEVQGTFFEPGIAVVFGNQTPTPTNVTATSFDVLVGPQSGEVPVTVTRLNGESDAATFSFGDGLHSSNPVDGAALDFDVFGSSLLVGRSGSYNVLTLGPVDDPIVANNIAVAWSPSGRVAAARYTSATLSYVVDTDDDLLLSDETDATIESNINVEHASLVFDESGRPAIGYLRTSPGTQVMLARDVSGDGDFADPGELVQVQSFGGTIVRRSELAIDLSGRAAYLYQTGGTNTLRVAWDRSGDGDFNDTVGGTKEKSVVLGGSGDTDCFGITFDSVGRLVLTYQNPTNSALVLARDVNGDGDVNDGGERTELAASVTVCDVERTAAGGLQLVHGGSGLFRLFDANDDGDFSDSGESLTLIPPPTSVDAVEIGSDEWTATETNVYVVP